MSKILIADDSQFMRSILKTILAQGGYTNVIEAANGVEAVEKAKSENPDLVLMDIIMPQMDGMQALEKIGINSDVVMVTAVGQEEMVKKAMSLGAKDFVVKPFNARKVLEIVKRVVG